MAKTITNRTPEQLQKIALIRAINDVVDTMPPLRNYRWERAVAHAPAHSLQSILDHLQSARALLQIVGDVDIVNVPEVR
jgi:hypothetical protein